MRSYQQLLEASRNANQPRKDSIKNFDDLLYILNSDLRLISPADPEAPVKDEDGGTSDEGSGPESEGSASTSALDVQPPVVGARSYQLTHDYLVHSLRDWLNREEQATVRGRARLLI